MSGRGRDRQPPPRSTAEWASLGFALLLLAAVIGTVIVLWLTPETDPPQFRVEPGAVRDTGGQFYLDITVRNDGEQTASEVTVEGVIEDGSRQETATTTFAFIPGHAEVQGTLVFTRDPAAARIRVVSFQRP